MSQSVYTVRCGVLMGGAEREREIESCLECHREIALVCSSYHSKVPSSLSLVVVLLICGVKH